MLNICFIQAITYHSSYGDPQRRAGVPPLPLSLDELGFETLASMSRVDILGKEKIQGVERVPRCTRTAVGLEAGV